MVQRERTSFAGRKKETQADFSFASKVGQKGEKPNPKENWSYHYALEVECLGNWKFTVPRMVGERGAESWLKGKRFPEASAPLGKGGRKSREANPVDDCSSK